MPLPSRSDSLRCSSCSRQRASTTRHTDSSRCDVIDALTAKLSQICLHAFPHHALQMHSLDGRG
eukprot:1958516-Pleurochrysis_carterae.AAC.2